MKKELCVKLVIYKHYNEMHGQQNIKTIINVTISCYSLRNFTLRRIVVPYRRFGTTYQFRSSRVQAVQSSQEVLAFFSDCFTLE